MNIDIKTLFPNASGDTVAANHHLMAAYGGSGKQNPVQPIVATKKAKHETNHQRKIQDSEPQHHPPQALDGLAAREKKGIRATVVRFVGYRVRPLDPDNFAGSTKDLLDGCVKAGLLLGDEWWRITLETRQEKVKSYAEERTVIEIEF